MPPLVRLVRPLNFVLSVCVVGLGAVLAAGAEAFAAETLAGLALAMASAALVGGASNALNDVADLDIDRINRPERPIPAGDVSVAQARAVWAGMSLAGAALGLAASPALGAIAGGSVLVLWLYNVRLKGTPGPGNVAASAVIAAALLYGALAVGEPNAAVWVGVGLTFALTLAREIVKDVEDAEGDVRGGARTLAVVLGERRALAVALAVLGCTLAALPLPALVGVGGAWLAYALPCAACLLVALRAAGLGLGDDARRRGLARRASGWLKAAMVAGIVALAAARLGA